MDYKALIKALKFIFLPTLAVLLFIWFATLSLTGVLSFIVSDSGWAITVRILLLLVEGGLVWYMYDKYKIEHILESDGSIPSSGWINILSYDYVRDSIGGDYAGYGFYKKVLNNNTVLIRKIKHK